jgi:hypothetical protein
MMAKIIIIFLRTFSHCQGFLNHLGFLDHIQLTHTVGLLWTSDQPVAEASTYTGQHNIETQETNIHALSGIRTRDPSNQAAADLRLRPRGYRGRHIYIFTYTCYPLHLISSSLSLISSLSSLFLTVLPHFYRMKRVLFNS